ncbi:MAG: C13 family peptidase [Caldilineaceae bacterium]
MMDHGLENKFCVTGCGAGKVITPDDLDGWLRTLETDTGVTEVTVIYEACLSNSFIQREGATGSISKLNRVIITSTGADNNAYASAQGAYFSDAFFSCVVDSNNLNACFTEAKSAVLATGVNQTPFLDDNGDGVCDPAQDGAVAGRLRW